MQTYFTYFDDNKNEITQANKAKCQICDVMFTSVCGMLDGRQKPLHGLIFCLERKPIEAFKPVIGIQETSF